MQPLDSNIIPTINNGALEVTTKEIENKTYATVTQYNSDPIQHECCSARLCAGHRQQTNPTTLRLWPSKKGTSGRSNGYFGNHQWKDNSNYIDGNEMKVDMQ